jgi:hypothetical protein
LLRHRSTRKQPTTITSRPTVSCSLVRTPCLHGGEGAMQEGAAQRIVDAVQTSQGRVQHQHLLVATPWM